MKDVSNRKVLLAGVWLAVGTCLVLVALVAAERPPDVVGAADGSRCPFPVARKRPSDAAAEPVEPADNSYCYVCHVNYKKDELTLAHRAVGVGCETCHGMSDEHSADEDGLTPPEKMYPRDRINPYCMTCHPRSGPAGDTGREQARAAEPTKVCTDCHGEHRLKVRTRVWDRSTGKLISDDGVRMMYEESPAGHAR